MDARIRLQLAEAFGPINRWFCSEAYGCEVLDLELLLTYYIKSGGARSFAERFNQATGKVNRWYCSEFYRRDIRDPETLWDYYMKYAPLSLGGKDRKDQSNGSRGGLDIAC
jgi:hypothetical protein